jgi:class 3 adenylate cyclase
MVIALERCNRRDCYELRARCRRNGAESRGPVGADTQRRFAAYNADASETLSVRIGIDAGEPVEDHNDLFGSTVQLASRLCGRDRASSLA